jgi:copper chaperone
MIEFTVDDMTCGHCESTIRRVVKEIDAASRCDIDLAGKRVRIESARTPAEFRTAIEEAGYTPVPVP